MLIPTDVRYVRQRVYRVIGRDLYSTPTNQPFDRQEYELEKQGVIVEGIDPRTVHLVIREGMVWLEDERIKNPVRS
jgi:hypothetical protein